MAHYWVAGVTLASRLPLPELREVPAQDGAWTFRLLPPGPAPPAAEPFHDIRTPDGELWLALIRCDEGYVLRFPELASFRLQLPRRLVSCFPEADVDDDTIRHLLIDQVLPYLLACLGQIVLHGSAVETDYGAIAFVGASGAGKSTLAASFALDGYTLVADDFLLVEAEGDSFVATPAYDGVRLWPESLEALTRGQAEVSRPVAQYSDKRRLSPAPWRGAGARRVLAAVAVLDDEPYGPGIRVERMGVRDSFLALFQAAFRLERSGQSRQASEFDRFLRLATSTSAFRLGFERGFDLLPAVRQELLDCVAALGLPTAAGRRLPWRAPSG